MAGRSADTHTAYTLDGKGQQSQSLLLIVANGKGLVVMHMGLLPNAIDKKVPRSQRRAPPFV
jgi:hypothetical protein